MRLKDPLDMTGAWFGHYAYADGRPPVQFIATLAETKGGGFGGGVSEPNSIGQTGPFLNAVIDGVRRGRVFRFTKLYDGEADAAHAIAYAGELLPGGEEAAGRWILPTDSGTFRMTRTHVVDDEAEDEVKVTAGRSRRA